MSVNKLSKGRVGAKTVDLPGTSLRTIVVDIPATTPASAVGIGVIPAGSRILDAYVRVDAAPSTASTLFDVGTTASAAWLLNGISLAATGIKQGSLVAGAVTLGQGLFEGSATSGLFTKPFVVDTAVTLAYTARGAITSADTRIVIKYEKL